MSMKESYESPKPDNLFAANQVMPVVTGKITLTTPAERGTPLDKNGDLSGGDDNFYGIAAESGTVGDTIAVYLTGEFNVDVLNTALPDPVFSDGQIIANRIFIKSNQTA